MASELSTIILEKGTPEERPAMAKVNGKPYLNQGRSFTIGNLENTLREKYGEVKVEQNWWLAKVCGVDDYTLSIDIKHRETAEGVKKYMMDVFGQKPLGCPLNYQYQNPDWVITLFLYYQTKNGGFHLQFFNVLESDSKIKKCAE